jgi:WD40 repeat protein/tRNA A-37 threonylcarbamoyl transferase component Bud32
MQIRCPHCHNPIEVVDADPLTDVSCPNCGSNFSLICGETASYTAGAVRTIGHFELLESLGDGHFGAVWKARDTKLDRMVAVKIPRKGQLDGPEAEMFLRDARAAAQVKHPGVAGVHEVGREGGTLYIVSDFIDGCNLKDWLSGRKLTPREAAELCVKIAEALHEAHESGVVHRDLKPSNIMIDMAGEPHIIDFGLAKREAGEITMTVDGQILGTPAYMSPEQARGQAHLADRRTDIYSMGVILFELLTGERPFRGAQRMMIVQIQNDDPPRPRRLQSQIPRDLETICLKCLEKNPECRFPTASRLADELGRFLGGKPIQSRPVGPAYRFLRWCKCNPLVAGLSATAILSLAATAVVAMIGYLNTSCALGIARQREEEATSARLTAEDAVDREHKALVAETITLADMHASFGLFAGEQNRPNEAVLWFASAANLAQTEPQRKLSNYARFQTWARHLASPVAALPHPGQQVTRIIFHPTDRYLLVFTTNGCYTIWDVQTGQVAKLRIAAKGSGCAAWSPDGRLLAIGSSRGKIEIYSFPECRQLHTLGHPGVARALTFSSDGAYLAIGSETVRVWSTAKREFLTGELPHPQAVVGIDFDSANRRLVTSCLDNKARVFAVNSEQVRATPLFSPVEHHVAYPALWTTGFCATFIANSGLLVSKDYQVLRWLDAETGKEIRNLPLSNAHITTVKPSFDRRKFIICGFPRCEIWDATRSDGIGIDLKHTVGVPDATFHPDGQSLVTACGDGVAHFWSVPGGQIRDIRLDHQSVLMHVAYSFSGKFIATAQSDGLVRVWKPPLPLRMKRISVHPISKYFRLVLSSDGRFVLVSGARIQWSVPYIQVYETASGKAMGPPLKAGVQINGAAFSTDGNQVIAALMPSGDKRGGIVIWDWRSGTRSSSMVPTPSEPADVAYSPTGDYAVAVCTQGEVLILDVKTARVIRRVNHGASAVTWWQDPKRWIVFSPDGKYFATLGLGHMVRIWTATGELAGSVQHQDTVRQAVFSPNGDYLATASDDHSAMISKVASGQLVTRLPHPDWVFAVQFSHDQRQLLTACRDRMARLWEWKKGCLVCPGFEHQDEVWDSRFTPDQRWILTLGKDDTIRGWESQTAKPVMPPIPVSGGGFAIRDLLIASNGRYIAVPGTDDFGLFDLTDTALVKADSLDLVGLQLLAEIYSGRRIQASGTVKLTADEWLERWRSFQAKYPGYFASICRSETTKDDIGATDRTHLQKRVSSIRDLSSEDPPSVLQ